MIQNEFLLGDSHDVLSTIESGTVHAVVTSPPYWGQRDYGVDGQIGEEESIEEYISNIVEISKEIKRVLRHDGSFFINLGDKYVNKEKQCIPHRIAQRLSDIGFVLRQDLVWSKPSSKPDPSTDRRSTEHEYVFHLTKSRDYWYDSTVCGGGHGSVLESPTAQSKMDHLAVYSEALVSDILDGAAPSSVCGECGTPFERSFESVPRPLTETDRKQSQRAFELYNESDLTEEHLRAIRSAGISDVGKAVETEDGAGRNSGGVIELACEAKDVLGGYYREFTMTERIPDGWTQACGCDGSPVGGTVLDPFMGSGTTASVAKRKGMNYLGIEINEEYVEGARERLSAI